MSERDSCHERMIWDTRLAVSPSSETRRGDDPAEPNYTQGSADARQLVAGRIYRTLIRTNPGNTNADRGYVNGQIGHRDPAFCFHTLCIYGDATETLVSAWDVTVPGIRSWTG